MKPPPPPPALIPDSVGYWLHSMLRICMEQVSFTPRTHRGMCICVRPGGFSDRDLIDVSEDDSYKPDKGKGDNRQSLLAKTKA